MQSWINSLSKGVSVRIICKKKTFEQMLKFNYLLFFYINKGFEDFCRLESLTWNFIFHTIMIGSKLSLRITQGCIIFCTRFIFFSPDGKYLIFLLVFRLRRGGGYLFQYSLFNSSFVTPLPTYFSTISNTHLEVYNHTKDENSGEQVHQVGQVLSVESFSQGTNLVLSGGQQVEKSDHGSLK